MILGDELDLSRTHRNYYFQNPEGNLPHLSKAAFSVLENIMLFI
jgi:hypothetical protein